MSDPVGEPEIQSLRRDWRWFTTSAFLFAFGFAMYNGVFQNFIKEDLGAQQVDLGRLESLREVPGLLTALTAGTLAALAESRVAGLGLAITALGIGLSGAMPDMFALTAMTVFWSIGFHLYATMTGPITLNLARGQEGGRHLGRMSSVGAIATITGLGLALLLSQLGQAGNYNVFFVIGGCAIGIAAVAMAGLSHHAAGAKRQRLVFRREYGLFYWLVFLDGCRRQIFSIFATFTLVKVYGVPVSTMLALQFVNAIIIAITAPQMGKWVDRVGEKIPLTWYAIGLIIVFLGYAAIPVLPVLFVLYLLDNALFTFSLGFTTYLHRIVRPGELTPCVSMGITMNHIAAVGIPISGALLWQATGQYQTPFWVAVALAVLALVATQKLPDGPRPVTAPDPRPSA